MQAEQKMIQAQDQIKSTYNLTQIQFRKNNLARANVQKSNRIKALELSSSL